MYVRKMYPHSLCRFRRFELPQHQGSTRSVDEDVWEEIRNFKKCLLKMFAARGQEPIFLETAVGLDKQKRHCMIECVPVGAMDAQDAPIYFKKVRRRLDWSRVRGWGGVGWG